MSRPVLAALGLLVLCAPLLIWGYRELQALPASPVVPDRPAPPVLPLAVATAASSTAELVVSVKRPLPAPTQDADRVWDLCGIGRLPRPVGAAAAGHDPWPGLPRHLGDEPTAQALQRLVETLDAGTPRQRAAAIMLRGFDAENVAAPRALSKLAAESRDPVVARWLLQRCGMTKSCSEQDLHLWTELEPDNLAAWLDLADRRPELKADIVAQAASRSRFQVHGSTLAEVVMQAMPAEVWPYVQMLVMTHAVGVEAALSLPSPVPLIHHCKAAASAADGAAARADCAAIARILTEHGDSLIGYMIGLRLREFGGAPPGPLEAERKRINDSIVSVGHSLVDAEQPLSCAMSERSTAWLQLRLRLGERGAIQALAAEAAAAAAASAPR